MAVKSFQTDSESCGLWQCHLDGSLKKVAHLSQPEEVRPPIIFIHGLEYSSPEEVARELVYPILEALGPKRIQDRNIYVFFWNGLILKDHKIDTYFRFSDFKILKFMFNHLPWCVSTLKDVEQRAKVCSQTLYDFARNWLFEKKIGPIVITHSMGSLVWAEVIKSALMNSNDFQNPGVWWSMQPAIERNALAKGGEFELVAKLYNGSHSAKSMIWYSRLDFILSSIYLLSKREYALGQLGCPVHSLPQRDITKWVKEAHGFTYLLKKLGPYTERIRPLIDDEANLLGIT